MSELNKRIAEALGYELQTDPTGSGLEAWYLVNRDAPGLRDSEGNRFVLIAPKRLPNWSGDLNMAIRLPLPTGHRLELTIFPDGGASASIYGQGTRYYDEYASGAAAAICASWLAWHAAKGQGNTEAGT